MTENKKMDKRKQKEVEGVSKRKNQSKKREETEGNRQKREN